MKRLIKNRKFECAIEVRETVIPTTPIYPQNYFKQRDPDTLRKNKERHDNSEYRSFAEILQEEQDNLLK